MRAALVSLALLISAPLVAADTETFRDWTVERPAFAGFLSGLTLGLDRFDLGGGREIASVYDPFSVTPTVRAELVRLGRTPYLLGRIVGTFCVLFLVMGVFFRRLNRLMFKETPL